VPPDERSSRISVNYGLSTKYWRTVAALQQALQILEMTDAIAVFVREMRKKAMGTHQLTEDMEALEPDPHWADDLLVAAYSGIRCWRRNGKTPGDIDKVTEDYIRCAADWQHTGIWRRDCVFVREHDEPTTRRGDAAPEAQGLLAARVLLVFKIRDPAPSVYSRRPIYYQGALVKLFHMPRSGVWRVNKMHGMSEVREWPSTTSHRATKL